MGKNGRCRTRELLNSFSKEVIIECFLSRNFLIRGLEYDLTRISWELESGAALKQMEDACREKAKHEILSLKWLDAEKNYQLANKRMARSDKLYEKLEQLRGKP